jgi:hypothetical protein
MGKLILMFLLMFSITSYIFAAESKVFTDDDLRKYQGDYGKSYEYNQKNLHQDKPEKELPEEQRTHKQYEKQIDLRETNPVIIISNIKNWVDMSLYKGNPYDDRIKKLGPKGPFIKEGAPDVDVHISADITNYGPSGKVIVECSPITSAYYPYTFYISEDMTTGETKSTESGTRMKMTAYESISGWSCGKAKIETSNRNFQPEVKVQ